MNSVAEHLGEYLRNVQYRPSHACLKVSELPEDFRDFGEELKAFAGNVLESKTYAQELSQGNLKCKAPLHGNGLAAPLMALHASLRHLVWQIERVAGGDYSQRIDLKGDFAEAFGNMLQQIEQRGVLVSKERTRLEQYMGFILSGIPDMLLVFDKGGKAVLASRAYVQKAPLASAGRVYGKTFTELFADVSPGKSVRDIERLMCHAVQDKYAYGIIRGLDMQGSGIVRMYSIHAAPMLFEKDVAIGIMVIIRDAALAQEVDKPSP